MRRRWNRLVCGCIRVVERMTKTSWPQWPIEVQWFISQRLLMKEE